MSQYTTSFELSELWVDTFSLLSLSLLSVWISAYSVVTVEVDARVSQEADLPVSDLQVLRSRAARWGSARPRSS